MVIGTQALQQLEYNFKKSLCKTQNVRNDIKNRVIMELGTYQS